MGLERRWREQRWRDPADAAQPAVAAVALPALGTALTFGADSPGSESKLSLGFIP